MPVPPGRSIVPITVVSREEHEAPARTSTGERAMLVVVGIMLFVLLLAVLVLPHLPDA
ncbi:MAG: hypothetical protein H6708_32170 [Kofleriaceae bacterium]|nr:hypothetical protein [Kofleriaceae bacterium]